MTAASGRRHQLRVLAFAATAVALGAACAGDDEAATPATMAEGAGSTIVATATLPDESLGAAPESTGASEAPNERELAGPALGLPAMSVLTEPSDSLRPLLAWESVDGAAGYSVTVWAPTGVGYWAWRTAATSVHLGGDPQLRDDVSGPSTTPGMTWSVLALDDDGAPIAASAETVLRP
jgi:hypothetical protein